MIVASGGAAGIEAFVASAADCILLDVRMPDIDGFAVCEGIRALPNGQDVPIIFLTALRDVDTFDRALRAGGDDFLTKPVRTTELVVRVQTALKLRRLRTELSEHYALLKRQRDDLMRAQLQKERLTAFIVHDLKGPLHAMDLLAQVLLEEGSGTAQVVAWLRQIRGAGRRLDRLIMNMLDLSKSDEGRLVPTMADHDVAALVHALIEEQKMGATQRKLTIRSSIESRTVHVDGELVTRALGNLLDNAIRHAPKGTEVSIDVVHRPGEVEIRIADQGKGVPIELRTAIFDAYVQAPDRVEHEGDPGQGLGLAFVRLVAEVHGGRVTIDPDAPSTFCLLLRSPS